MEGINISYLRSTPLFSNVVRELRTPLLEVLLMSRAQGDTQAELLTSHALKVYDSYVLLQEQLIALDNHMLPCSLVSETEDVLHSLDKLASFYDVTLQPVTKRLRSPVALNRRTYEHAAHSALYAVITSMQNTPGATIQISVNGKNGPSISIFSKDIQVLAEDMQAASSISGRQQPSPLVNGAISSLALADQLFATMGSQLQATSNQYGKGFQANFSYSRQMSLIEAL